VRRFGEEERSARGRRLPFLLVFDVVAADAEDAAHRESARSMAMGSEGMSQLLITYSIFMAGQHRSKEVLAEWPGRREGVFS
jgi:hypothetical protein